MESEADGWKSLSHDSDLPLSIDARTVAGSSIPMIRARVVLPISLDAAVEALSSRSEWEQGAVFESLGDYDDKTKITRTCYAGVGPVSGREFIDISRTDRAPGYMHATAYIDAAKMPRAPPVPKGVKRGTIMVSGTVLRSVPEGVSVCTLNHIDSKLNMFCKTFANKALPGRTAEWCAALKQAGLRVMARMQAAEGGTAAESGDNSTAWIDQDLARIETELNHSDNENDSENQDLRRSLQTAAFKSAMDAAYESWDVGQLTQDEYLAIEAAATSGLALEAAREQLDQGLISATEFALIADVIEIGMGRDVERSASPEDVLATHCQQVLARAREVDQEPDWNWVNSVPKELTECQLEYKEKGALVMVRVKCVMPVPPTIILDTVLRGGGLPKGTEKRVLQTLRPDLLTAWVSVKLPMPFKDRDFVFGQWVQLAEDGECVIVQTSLDKTTASQICPPTKRFQRGKILLQAMIISPIHGTNKSIFTWLSCVDPKGSVPSAKSMTAKSTAESVVALQAAALAQH
eukprot:TRINITY_DN6933_c0_g1_i5.p1 TRINITY_DN6933_c0_g1~~TRINITY_DN6933_c0_g1_i5.p1  ORF type:complete len:520 (-),score=117.64 TRINITY_DN6933_c0_g1_i5:423-1982(-)